MIPFEHAERLTRLFDGWPSFHDTEIVRLRLDRGGADGPSLEAEIHLFVATSELDAQRCFVRAKHTLATLRFSEIRLDRLSDFNNQNVIFDLQVTEIDPAAHEGRRYRVHVSTSHGCGLELDCVRLSVVDARPCEARP